MTALYLHPGDMQDPKRVCDAVNQYAQGATNAAKTFTLTASATSTVVTDNNCKPSSIILWAPQTQHAANDMATLSYVAAKGSFTLTHANNARVDRTFGYVVLG